MQLSIGLNFSPVPSTFNFQPLREKISLPKVPGFNFQENVNDIRISKTKQGWCVLNSHRQPVNTFPNEEAIRIFLDEQYAPESDWLH
jgi:hypothetical protein